MAVFVGLGTDFGVGLGVGVGVGAATMSGDGPDAGELATFELAGVLAGSELTGAALEALVARVVGEPAAGVDVAPADDG